MKNIREELKEIIVYEKMYCIKNKQRFGLRYYKKHPKKLDSRRRKIIKSLRGYCCKGSDFDFPILNAYLDAYKLATPWPFWSQRDYRTLQAVFPFIKAEEKNGEKHNALEDARAQMRGLEYFVTLEAIFKEKPNKVKTITN